MPVTVANHSIDEPRPLKVITVGAGISGILAGIRLPQRVKNLVLTIYDKNPEFSGTWYENRYPGVACDIPAHSYQLSFEPNPQWSQFYATGAELFRYWKGIALKYGVDKYAKLSHKVLEARYDEAKNIWSVKVQNLITNEIFIDTCDIFYVAVGTLNDWKWPDIKGLKDFRGQLLHSAAWDESFDPTGKSVAVIGAGSSAIQIVPAIQPKVMNLDNYVRGKTWICPPILQEEVDKHNADVNFEFTTEEINLFMTDKDHFLKYRKAIEDEIQSGHSSTFIGKDSDTAALIFAALMQKKLAKRPEIFKSLLPDFPPICRRLTPGPGYLNALVQDNVNFITTGIDHISETGIVTVDGQLREADAIVCATGFNTTFTGRFPIYGRNGVCLNDRWQGYPETYISLAVDGFPNMFVAFGPNAAVGTGSLSMMLEKVCDYVSFAIQKISNEYISVMEVKSDSVKNFVEFCKQYFQKTVFTQPCQSWYKGGTKDGPVIALWPGSSLHSIHVFDHPRWEDYDYKYVNDNPFEWFGNGWSNIEKEEGTDRSYYLNPNIVDFPPVPGKSI
ncbi:uncharacterized protein V1516DRAFT_626211 [Lipomyces oligophaga]|uniref:uncharacterized protein n=1 Tax=Lipomyces oligophaga TaxID=45792 RepID=UPI0034CE7150